MAFPQPDSIKEVKKILFYDFYLAFKDIFSDTEKLFAYRAVSKSFITM